ncbi:unnamed protein product [Rhizoctonia solani]|uniref:F-box domain-containing protein n=1 Tax=Rhizoctonia solani TaxID=456999 RepID=A0A8H2WDX7_9AGAM|nr:unnamed protein product [Rhizoctonia solani]
MATSINELEDASNELEAALDEYLNACFVTPNLETTLGTQKIVCVPGSNDYELIAKEYPRVALFEKQIKQAKAAISASRNTSSVTVPVNALPVEVLIRIFEFVANAESCKLGPRSQTYMKMPQYPVLLTHVCAHWRRIIIGTPLFWTHIDAAPHLYNSKRLRDRTQTFIERAYHSTLDIHISTVYPTDEYWEATGLNEFLAPLIHRIQSLDLEISLEYTGIYDPQPSARDFCSSILSNCFGANCMPGTLTQVSLKTDAEYLFLEPAETNTHGNRLALEVPASHLQNIWRCVTILRVDNLFPFWTSIAYSGLVELCLGTYDQFNSGTISTYHLSQILSSSPQLRVLHFGLHVVPTDNPSKAVLLSHLRILVLCPKTTNDLESITRLLTLAPEPLHMTIYSPQDNPDEAYITTEIARFFARSNIATLHFVGTTNCFKTLSLVSTLQTLAFTTYSGEDINTVLGCNKPHDLYPKRLHLLGIGDQIDVAMGALVQFVKMYMPQQFLIWGLYGIICDQSPTKCSVTQIEQELSSTGITSQVLLSEPPDPTEYSLMSF